MAKNWEEVFNNKIGSSNKSIRVKDNLNRNNKSLSFEDLKKEGDKLYDKKVAEENKLVQAYEDKKLKNKQLIKKARDIIAKREKTVKEAS